MKRFSLVIAFVALAAGSPAQTFNVLYDWPGILGTVRPETTLALSEDTLYGATTYGGVFKIKTDGTAYAGLHLFSSSSGGAPSELLPVGSMLYGVAPNKTNYQTSVVFKMGTDGSNYSELANIDGSNASYPEAGLLLLGDTFYGTTCQGGSWGRGTVFKVNTNGGGYEVLHSFAALDGSYHNSEGANPLAGLTSDGGTLFGTATGGGSNRFGTVFKLSLDGSGFTVLHTFSGADGVVPWCRLLLRGDTLYGTTAGDTSGGLGTVFKVDTNGDGFAVLYDIPASSSNTCGNCGARGGLVLRGNTLYGTCQNDGNWDARGNIFKVNTDGSGFAKLKVFLPGYGGTNADGELPLGGLVMGGNTLYGTAAAGGPHNAGTIFSLQLPCTDCPPTISSVTQTNGALVFTWSAISGSSYQVQYITDAATTNWDNLGSPLLATNNTLSTSDVIGPDSQRFYRVVLMVP